MSAALYTVPYTSDLSAHSLHQESLCEEEATTIHAVIITLTVESIEQNAAAYRPLPSKNSDEDATLGSSATGQKKQSFVAQLALNCKTAMASLFTQPPGTFLLVTKQDASLAVFIKFRQSIRVLPLLKGKDVKQNVDASNLTQLSENETPVYNLCLAFEAYCRVEYCWKDFLPQVQAIVFELCCEPHFIEDLKLEDWTLPMIPPSAYAVGLIPEVCGFYVLTVAGNGAEPSAVIAVRQVEFDVHKFVITIADGTLKPSALLLATSFSPKRTYHPSISFGTIRDNFLTPEQVMLKELSVTTISSRKSSLHNLVDISSTDQEVTVLGAVAASCETITPHEPLSSSFVAELNDMHLCFGDTTIRNRIDSFANLGQWSAQKMKLVGRIMPVLVELLTFSALFVETEALNDSKKQQAFARFASSMQVNIFSMVLRSDDAVVCRLVHQICQILSARVQIPAALVHTVRDLVASSPIFLRLFIRNQGMSLLWRTFRHHISDKDAVSGLIVRPKSTSRSFWARDALTNASHAIEGKRDRNLKWFGLSRKLTTKSRKLSVLPTKPLMPAPEASTLAFFRLRPLLVQSLHLHESSFLLPDALMEDPGPAKSTFDTSYKEPRKESVPCEERLMSGRKCLEAPLNCIMLELLLQVSLRLLYHKSFFVNWDRDVALMLRLTGLHQFLFDEIIRLGHEDPEATNPPLREASSCELRTAITCVSTLYRLERKRRLGMKFAIGNKKYLALIYSFRSKIREFNENLLASVPNGGKVGDYAGNEAASDDGCFNIINVVLTRIPKTLLNEWVVFCLKDLLETVTKLSDVVTQKEVPVAKQKLYVNYGSELCQVLAVVLRRMSDVDLQTLLVRILGICSPALRLLFRFLLAPRSLEVSGRKDVHVHVLELLRAFINLDIALPVRLNWEARHSIPRVEVNNHEDAEGIEQLKGELLIQLMGPRMAIHEDKQHEQTLWDYTLELVFPSPINTVGTSRMLQVALLFRSLNVSATNSRKEFCHMEAYLLVLQTLYIARDVNSPIDFEHCVASHWHHIENLCDTIHIKEKHDEFCMRNRLIELNVQCLIVLASQRSQTSAIQAAFDQTRVLSRVFQRLQPRSVALFDNAQLQRRNGEVLGHKEKYPATLSLPPLALSAQSKDTKMPQSNAQSVSVQHEINAVLLEPGVHALAIVLVLTYVLLDPNYELDEAVCPRIYVPGQAHADTREPNELLWRLQQHLALVKVDRKRLDTLMVEMETMPTSLSPARLAAIRILVRLVCPNRFDSQLYSAKEFGSTREYVAKGAFSTVYRQRSAIFPLELVAVKVIEHQRRAGGLCAISGLYSEVSILSNLRGNRAVTQLVDFGNVHDDQHFEIVLEYCPCSLADWGASMKRPEVELSCRSRLLAILRVFEEACRCLSHIHDAGVCHFDIKSDNILVRISAWDLSYRVLQNDVEGNRLDEALCFADFGEAKVIDTNQKPAQRSSYSSSSSGIPSPVAVEKQIEQFVTLTRTRGTEAIKSPEVLKINGSDKAVKITRAGDIWSMGCLLYELVTRELLFQNDDWAGLYAHLVVTQEDQVLRKDHEQKIIAALNPLGPDDEEVVQKLLELCSNILVREASRRPKLEGILAQVHKLITDVNALPMPASDEAFISFCLQNTEISNSKAQRAALDSQAPCIALSYRNHVETRKEIFPVRLFWNFFLAAKVTMPCNTKVVTHAVGSSPNSICQDMLAMDVFESSHEHNFVHFVYLSWHEPSNSCAYNVSRCFIEEVHEEEHRTCFLLNSHLSFELHDEVEHTAQYFALFQRCLRDKAGCVAFVALGKTEEDTKALQNVLVTMLFFFLRRTLNMSGFDIVTSFSRDCAPYFEYPKQAFLEHLVASSSTRCEDSESSTIVPCRCGANVLSFKSLALAEALVTQDGTCLSNKDTCPCFHPLDESWHDDVYPVDPMFIYDSAEKKLVLPLETQRLAVQWIVLDTVSVTRQSQSFDEKDRRISRFDNLKRRKSDLDVKSEVVRGLQRRGKHSLCSKTWDLYECDQCRLPICALGEDPTKVAVPML